MITLDEKDAFNRACHGAKTAVVTGDAFAKCREFAQLAAGLGGWDCFRHNFELTHVETGGALLIVPASQIYSMGTFDFIAVSANLGPTDRAFIQGKIQ
jgi:hypothetical protein